MTWSDARRKPLQNLVNKASSLSVLARPPSQVQLLGPRWSILSHCTDCTGVHFGTSAVMSLGKFCEAIFNVIPVDCWIKRLRKWCQLEDQSHDPMDILVLSWHNTGRIDYLKCYSDILLSKSRLSQQYIFTVAWFPLDVKGAHIPSSNPICMHNGHPLVISLLWMLSFIVNVLSSFSDSARVFLDHFNHHLVVAFFIHL